MTSEEIKRYKDSHKKTELIFDMLDDDVIMKSGHYKGMKLSDIYIIFPEYINFIINYDNADKALKMIAKQIRDDANLFNENISREIALA